jgi:hypothetical protein
MRTNSFKYFAAITVLAAGSEFGQAAPLHQTFPLQDSAGLVALNVKTEAVEYKGRKAIRVTTNEGIEHGFAILPGTDFQDGVIEADIALKIMAPPGVRIPGFVGIAFRSRKDASHYEMFYLRPGNSSSPDQARRNHSVQYVAEPGFGWYKLRREWPWIYEAHAELQPETWTKVKIEVAGRAAKLYLNGSAQPSLVVDGLKGEDLRGSVALWGYAAEESYFSNVRITNTAAVETVKNGSDVAGTWEVHYASDAGKLDGSLKLSREGSKVTGTWSGALGTECPVEGTWRDGYVELSFAGEWPKDADQGAPGPVKAFLAGWVDGTSAKGRMRVEGRADGLWTAKLN